MATIATLHRVRCRWSQLVIEEDEGFFEMRRAYLLHGVAHPREALHPMAKLLQRMQRRLRAATTGKQGGARVHNLAQLAPMRPPSGHGEESLALTRLPTTFDQQEAILEHVTDFLLDG